MGHELREMGQGPPVVFTWGQGGGIMVSALGSITHDPAPLKLRPEQEHPQKVKNVIGSLFIIDPEVTLGVLHITSRACGVKEDKRQINNIVPPPIPTLSRMHHGVCLNTKNIGSYCWHIAGENSLVPLLSTTWGSSYWPIDTGMGGKPNKFFSKWPPRYQCQYPNNIPPK